MPYRELAARMKEVERLRHSLRTHQVDAIVGKRHVMVARLKHAEEDLKRSRNQLRALATNLLSVRDAERASIARELHDEFGQALFSLELGLAWISKRLLPGQKDLRNRVASLSITTASLIRSVTTIARQLRPGTLDELGLVKTLDVEAREFAEETGIPCAFRTNATKTRFGRATAVALFRILQAALTNVARHAGASRVNIALMKNTKELTLTVTDDGKGIDRVVLVSRKSMGIVGMQERAAGIGGTLTLHAAGKRGTRLAVRLPLARIFPRGPRTR